MKPSELFHVLDITKSTCDALNQFYDRIVELFGGFKMLFEMLRLENIIAVVYLAL
jgi:hypothetical protein